MGVSDEISNYIYIKTFIYHEATSELFWLKEKAILRFVQRASCQGMAKKSKYYRTRTTHGHGKQRM